MPGANLVYIITVNIYERRGALLLTDISYATSTNHAFLLSKRSRSLIKKTFCEIFFRLPNEILIQQLLIQIFGLENFKLEFGLTL